MKIYFNLLIWLVLTIANSSFASQSHDLKNIERARVLKADGQTAKAISLLEKSGARNHPVGIFNLACYYSIANQPAKSAEHIRRLVNLIFSQRVERKLSRKLQFALVSDPDLENVFFSPFWPKELIQKLELGKILYGCTSPFKDIVAAVRDRAKVVDRCVRHVECQTVQVSEKDTSRKLLFDLSTFSRSFVTREREGVKGKNNIEIDGEDEDLYVFSGTREIPLKDLLEKAKSYNQCQILAYGKLKALLPDSDDYADTYFAPKITISQGKESLYCIKNICQELQEEHDSELLQIETSEELKPGYQKNLIRTFEELLRIYKERGVEAAESYYNVNNVFTLPCPLQFREEFASLKEALAQKSRQDEANCESATQKLQETVASNSKICSSPADCIQVKIWDCCGDVHLGSVFKTRTIVSAISDYKRLCEKILRPECDCSLPESD